MATYEAVLVARTPQLSGFPGLTLVDRLVCETITYSEELSRPGSATLSCPLSKLSDACKQRLANLATFPCEVWVYREDVIVWAGEVQTLSLDGVRLTLNCVGLLGYTFRMFVEDTQTFLDVDQHTIAKELIDGWQNDDYGHFGIDTDVVVASGVLRDRTYERDELHNIGMRLQELAAVSNGFDIYVNPSDRNLVLYHPGKGLDLSDSVFLDKRNILSTNVVCSVAPDDLVSDLQVTGSGSNDDLEQIGTYYKSTNTSLRNSFGKTGGAAHYPGVIEVPTLITHGDAYRNARDRIFFQPGVTLRPIQGADVIDFGPGDTVTYSFDAGLGLQTGAFRVAKMQTEVSGEGDQRIRVEFA